MELYSVKEIMTRRNEDSPDNGLIQTYDLTSDELYGLYEQLFVAMADESFYDPTCPDIN